MSLYPLGGRGFIESIFKRPFEDGLQSQPPSYATGWSCEFSPSLRYLRPSLGRKSHAKLSPSLRYLRPRLGRKSHAKLSPSLRYGAQVHHRAFPKPSTIAPYLIKIPNRIDFRPIWALITSGFSNRGTPLKLLGLVPPART